MVQISQTAFKNKDVCVNIHQNSANGIQSSVELGVKNKRQRHDKAGLSWPGGYSMSIKHALQSWWEEMHRKIHILDDLQQQKILKYQVSLLRACEAHRNWRFLKYHQVFSNLVYFWQEPIINTLLKMSVKLRVKFCKITT